MAVGMSGQCVSLAGHGDTPPEAGIGKQSTHLFNCLIVTPIPDRMQIMLGEPFDALDVLTQKQTAGPEYSPQAVRGSTLLFHPLGRQGVHSERDFGRRDRLREFLTHQPATGYRQGVGRLLPTRTADLEPADRGNRLKHRVASGILARSHERHIALVTRRKVDGRTVERGIESLGKKLGDCCAGRSQCIDLIPVGREDAPGQPGQCHDRLRQRGGRVEIPEGRISSSHYGLDSPATCRNRMSGAQHEVGLESLGSPAEKLRRQWSQSAAPAQRIEHYRGVPQRHRGAGDRRFGAMIPAGTKDENPHE